MKKQAFNPYLPSWEYIPDGEPYIFDGRVYIYGSHDSFGGIVYCTGDYVCWSAPVDDLGNWRYEGVIYRRTDDPLNKNNDCALYAPDVAKGPDGRYYLYYVLESIDVVSVAVCDTPAGKYEFYGYVHYKDGIRLGEKEGDEPQFDPGVLCEGDKVYLYTGFVGHNDPTRHGAMVTVLSSDMLTIEEAPRFIVPGKHHSAGSGYEGHAFFEASSIRKHGDTYYFVYSSELMYELCYATSKSPTESFVYGGTLVANNDIGIGDYKPRTMPANFGGNNHGSIIEINGQWYVFYHRHTNGRYYSRQVCAEPITIAADGSIKQVELTSCGLNGGPLIGKDTYPAYIACNLFTQGDEYPYMCKNGQWTDANHPIITGDGRDGDEVNGYIHNLRGDGVVGFKYFDCKDVKRIGVKVCGVTGSGRSGIMEVRLKWDGEVVGEIPIGHCSAPTEFFSDVNIPDGVHALYFTFKGNGAGYVAFYEFTLE